MRRVLVVLAVMLSPALASAQGIGTPAFRGQVLFPLTFSPDNTYDIGADGATRPRSGYFGTSLFTPALTVSGLTATRCTFAGTGGLLSDDADCTFGGSRLTVTDLTAGTATVSALTSGRVTFAGPAGLLADDADMTFDGTSLSVDRVLTDAGSAAAPNLARAADTDDGILLGEVSYFVRDSVENAGFSSSGATTTMRLCTSGATGCGTFQELSGQTTGIGITALALTASTMTAEASAKMRTVTHSYTWTNAQVVALGATTTGDINVATLPAKTRIIDALLVVTGAAVGPTTVTVSCGDAIDGTPFDNLILPASVKVAANTVYGDAIDGSETGASLFDATNKWHPYLPSYTATTLITCHFISTGANLSTVTGSTGRVILTTRLEP